MMARPYTPADRDACLEIFTSNMPRYFVAAERSAFANYLDEHSESYWVIVDRDGAGGSIACGGIYYQRQLRTARLCWGMVHSGHHKRGVGRLLLLLRLERICGEPGIDAIQFDTSQHTFGFFEKLGFVTDGITENSYAPGLHRYDMTLKLTESAREGLGRHIERYLQDIDII